MLPEDVRIWVNERKPKNSQEAGQLAENYLQARSTTEPKRSQETERIPTTRWPKCGLYGHWACDVLSNRPKADTSSVKPPEYPQTRPHCLESVSCFKCNEKGHIAANCPRKSFLLQPEGDLCPQRSSLHVDAPSDGFSGVNMHWSIRQGTINDQPCDPPELLSLLTLQSRQLSE